MRGDALAERITDETASDIDTLGAAGIKPVLGTVMMSDDETDQSFMDRKHERCASAGIGTKRIDVPEDAPAAECYDAVERLATAADVTALFVQIPLPDHVNTFAVRTRVPPGKDIDCFAPVNLGRLAAGSPAVTPPTAAAVLTLLDAYDVPTEGEDVVVVGRNTAICKPLVHRLLSPAWNATVTVCHTRTRDLRAKTRQADVLVTAAGDPGLVDGSMVNEDVSVVDISVNRVPAKTDRGYELVGDVDFESVAEKATAITPVPGSVGPLTLAHLLRNVVDVTAKESAVDLV